VEQKDTQGETHHCTAAASPPRASWWKTRQVTPGARCYPSTNTGTQWSWKILPLQDTDGENILLGGNDSKSEWIYLQYSELMASNSLPRH